MTHPYFSAVESAPTNEGILAAEENYHGGVADLGDSEAAHHIQAMPGYWDYRSHLENAAAQHLGYTFPAWRSMPQEQYDAWRNGDDIGPVSVTLNQDLANKWGSLAQTGGPRKVVQLNVPASSIIMRGKPEEHELVVDANQIELPLEKGVMQRLHPNKHSDKEINGEQPGKYKDPTNRVYGWQKAGNSDSRDRIPAMTGDVLARALHRMHSKTKVRRNPKTGTREFLLHRGMDTMEHKWGTKHTPTPDTHWGPGPVTGTDGEPRPNLTSWTTDPDQANFFAKQYKDLDRNPGPIVSAWVPESHIHAVPNMSPNRADKYIPEQEVIIRPGTFELDKPLQRSEDEFDLEFLAKAIRPTSIDLATTPPGKGKNTPGHKAKYGSGDRHEYDYSHLLPKEFQGKYILKVQSPQGYSRATVYASSPYEKEYNWRQVLTLSGNHLADPDGAVTIEPHIGQLRDRRAAGVSIYALHALMAHARNHHGIRKITVPAHTPAAGNLIRKYIGMIGGEYKGQPIPNDYARIAYEEGGEFDPYLTEPSHLMSGFEQVIKTEEPDWRSVAAHLRDTLPDAGDCYTMADAVAKAMSSLGHRAYVESGTAFNPRIQETVPHAWVSLNGQIADPHGAAYDIEYSDHKIGDDPIAKSEYEESQAASVWITDSAWLTLWGQRQDGKWSLPGGHVEPQEDPTDAAKREVFEETGLVPQSMHRIGSVRNGDILVHLYHAFAEGEPGPHNDPDNEFQAYLWVDCFDGIPPEIANNLAHPENLMLQWLGHQTRQNQP